MQNHKKLRLALRLNAGFSSLSALVILFSHASLGDLMGVASPMLLTAALGLGAFAAHLIFTAARSDSAKLRAESLRHSIADFAWVVASIAIMISGVLTPAGGWLLAAVSLPVLALGIAQWRTLPASDSTALAAEA
jgi:hypothetical protein